MNSLCMTLKFDWGNIIGVPVGIYKKTERSRSRESARERERERESERERDFFYHIAH